MASEKADIPSSVSGMPPPSDGPRSPGPVVVSPAVLEALRIAGDRLITPDDDTRAAIIAAGHDKVEGVYKFCITLEGDISSVKTVNSSRFNAFDAKVLATIRNTWSFSPYVATTENVTEVCAPFRAVYEARPSPRNVAAEVLEATRIAGNKQIVPSAYAEAEIRSVGKHHLRGAYDLCTTPGGIIDVVIQIESTGSPAYDAEVINVIRRDWRYRPLLVNGKATPVCAPATITYEHRAPSQRKPPR
jgi:hypothetical protein